MLHAGGIVDRQFHAGLDHAGIAASTISLDLQQHERRPVFLRAENRVRRHSVGLRGKLLGAANVPLGQSGAGLTSHLERPLFIAARETNTTAGRTIRRRSVDSNEIEAAFTPRGQLIARLAIRRVAILISTNALGCNSLQKRVGMRFDRIELYRLLFRFAGQSLGLVEFPPPQQTFGFLHQHLCILLAITF